MPVQWYPVWKSDAGMTESRRKSWNDHKNFSAVLNEHVPRLIRYSDCVEKCKWCCGKSIVLSFLLIFTGFNCKVRQWQAKSWLRLHYSGSFFLFWFCSLSLSLSVLSVFSCLNMSKTEEAKPVDLKADDNSFWISHFSFTSSIALLNSCLEKESFNLIFRISEGFHPFNILLGRLGYSPFTIFVNCLSWSYDMNDQFSDWKNSFCHGTFLYEESPKDKNNVPIK